MKALAGTERTFEVKQTHKAEQKQNLRGDMGQRLRLRVGTHQGGL